MSKSNKIMGLQKQVLRCSFCGKSQSEVKKLVAGAHAYICDECIATASYAVNAAAPAPALLQKDDIQIQPVKPHELYNRLNDYVIEQDNAKKILSVAVYNHYKRLTCLKDEGDEVEIAKSNILLIGPTGSGKTLLAQTLAKILDVPLAIADATSFTVAGYVGDDVENILHRLLQVANDNIERAQKGIVYIDEIDKISRKSEHPSVTKDAAGEGVQQALLKIIEGTTVSFPKQGSRRHMNQEMVTMDTTNILFICGGAFDGLGNIVSNRVSSASIGFEARIKSKDKANINELFNLIEPHDLIKFGLIPELIGRLPVTAILNELDTKALKEALLKPKNSLIKQFKKLFAMEGVELEFSDAALDAIVEVAWKRKTGARGLRAVLESALLDIMFDVPSQSGIEKIIIEEGTITDGKKPLIIYSDIKKSKAA